MGRRVVISAATLALVALAPVAAEAAPGHRHARPFFPRTTVFIAPFYAMPPFYYRYPPVYYPSAPVTYIEQGPQAPQTLVPPQLFSGALWYCPSVGVYYPNVPQCPVDWQRVTPPPPPEKALESQEPPGVAGGDGG